MSYGTKAEWVQGEIKTGFIKTIWESGLEDAAAADPDMEVQHSSQWDNDLTWIVHHKTLSVDSQTLIIHYTITFFRCSQVSQVFLLIRTYS